MIERCTCIFCTNLPSPPPRKGRRGPQAKNQWKKRGLSPEVAAKRYRLTTKKESNETLRDSKER